MFCLSSKVAFIRIWAKLLTTCLTSDGKGFPSTVCSEPLSVSHPKWIFKSWSSKFLLSSGAPVKLQVPRVLSAVRTGSNPLFNRTPLNRPLSLSQDMSSSPSDESASTSLVVMSIGDWSDCRQAMATFSHARGP